MRVAAVGLVLAVVGALAAAVADLTVPFATFGHGSVSRAPISEGLEALPAQPPCGAPFATPCEARFAYAPNQKLTVWFSVRNESRVPLTLDGVPRRWFEQFPSELLMRPVALLDGGTWFEVFLGQWTRLFGRSSWRRWKNGWLVWNFGQRPMWPMPVPTGGRESESV